MEHKREHLEGLLELISQIADNPENQWFRNALTSKLKIQRDNSLEVVANEISGLRYVLELRGNPSIDYSFVTHEYTREKLVIDNLKMENIRFDSRETNHQVQFYKFCVYAFYQIENCINYFYSMAFSSLPEIQTFIEQNIQPTGRFSFERKPNQRTVSDIDIAFKSAAFCNRYINPDHRISYFLTDIRKVRNENAHRCSILVEPGSNTDTPEFYNVYRRYTMESITSQLTFFISEIKSELRNIGL